MSSLGLHFLVPKKVTRFEAHSFRDEVLEFVYLSPSSNCDLSSPPSSLISSLVHNSSFRLEAFQDALI